MDEGAKEQTPLLTLFKQGESHHGRGHGQSHHGQYQGGGPPSHSAGPHRRQPRPGAVTVLSEVQTVAPKAVGDEPQALRDLERFEQPDDVPVLLNVRQTRPADLVVMLVQALARAHADCFELGAADAVVRDVLGSTVAAVGPDADDVVPSTSAEPAAGTSSSSSTDEDPGVKLEVVRDSVDVQCLPSGWRKTLQGPGFVVVLGASAHVTEQTLFALARLRAPCDLGMVDGSQTSFVACVVQPQTAVYALQTAFEVGRSLCALLGDREFFANALTASSPDKLRHEARAFVQKTLLAPSALEKVSVDGASYGSRGHSGAVDASNTPDQQLALLHPYDPLLLRRTGRFGGGVMDDLRRRAPWYLANWYDTFGSTHDVLALLLACLLLRYGQRHCLWRSEQQQHVRQRAARGCFRGPRDAYHPSALWHDVGFLGRAAAYCPSNHRPSVCHVQRRLFTVLCLDWGLLFRRGVGTARCTRRRCLEFAWLPSSCTRHASGW
eukprot:m.380098 g.380098  ORF g.380098 m.380098 type:complete len:494 (+) comp20033_c0_seq14:118-1599(+)